MNACVVPRSPRVLVADTPPAHARVARALVGFELDFVTTLAGATAALRERSFDCVIVSMDLGESSALGVVREIRRRSPALSVICVRAAESRYCVPGATVHAFRLACSELGAMGLIDMFEFPDTPSGNSAIRDAIAELLHRRGLSADR